MRATKSHMVVGLTVIGKVQSEWVNAKYVQVSDIYLLINCKERRSDKNKNFS